MEYLLARAHEIARLGIYQIEKLHKFEKSESVPYGYDEKTNTVSGFINRIPRCLYPHEIQDGFKLSSISEHYGIPADFNLQGQHVQRLRVQLKSLNIFPSIPVTNTDIQSVHVFDDSLKPLVEQMKIDFSFQYSRGSGRIKERVGEYAD